MDSRRKIFKEEPECITDVVVELRSGERFLASFFCYAKIWEMKKEFEKSGKFLAGTYFWAKDMVLVDNIERGTIKKIVEHLIEEGDFLDVFRRISM